MSYYGMGDWYRGDYYRGDPGFFSFLGGLAKTAVGFIPGVGPALSAGLSTLGAKKPGFFSGASAAPRLPGGGAAAPTSTLMRLKQGVKAGVLKHPVLTGVGAAGLAGAALGGEALLAKHRLSGGGRRRRRMRATNTKALRRALRRAYAFERIAMKTIKLVHPRKHGRFGGFKKPKKRVC